MQKTQDVQNAVKQPVITFPPPPPSPDLPSSLIVGLPPSPRTKQHNKYSMDDMEKMRREIRQLQERRSVTMMNELVDLQRERDKALGRIKILKHTLNGISAENAMLRSRFGQDEPQHIQHLENTIKEEKLYSGDLKKKLQAANRHIASIQAELEDTQKAKENNVPGKVASAVSLLKVQSAEGDTSMERSQSMSDLEKEKGTKTEGMQKGGSPPAQYHLPRLTETRESQRAGSSSPGAVRYIPSPRSIPQRYKLAAAEYESVGIQVNIGMVQSKKEEKAAVKNEIEALEKEKRALEEVIAGLTAQKEDLREHAAKIKIKELKTETKLLTNSLSEFSKWVRQKIHLVDHDIDMCKVIYTLHGSLSQEKSIMKELQERQAFSQEKIEELYETNSKLRSNLEDAEEKRKQMKLLNELQREKIVLLTPAKFSKQTFYCPTPFTSSPKLSHCPPAHSASSPLLGTSRAAVGLPSFMEIEEPLASPKRSPACSKGAKGSCAPRKVIRGPHYAELTGSPSRERQYFFDEDGNIV